MNKYKTRSWTFLLTNYFKKSNTRQYLYNTKKFYKAFKIINEYSNGKYALFVERKAVYKS